MDRRSVLAGLSLTVATGSVAATAAARAAQAGNAATAFAAALNAHDIAAFAALFAEDYAQHQTSAAVTVRPGQGKTAKQATVDYFAARLRAMPDLRVTADPVVAASDMVASNFTYSGTHAGAYFGVPPTGRHITFNSCDILAVRDGLIVAHWGAVDLAGLLKQLHG